MLYIVDVHRHLNRRARLADEAFVRLFDDEPNTYEAETPTNALVRKGPVENNVAYYGGSFATLGDAIAVVQQDFPLATIDTEDVDSRLAGARRASR